MTKTFNQECESSWHFLSPAHLAQLLPAGFMCGHLHLPTLSQHSKQGWIPNDPPHLRGETYMDSAKTEQGEICKHGKVYQPGQKVKITDFFPKDVF